MLVDEREVYEEMRPFVSMIKQQHVDILNHAQMRQEFTANVSHELKTPLTAISGYAELIASGMTNERDTEHFANEIHRSAERLQSLINDIIKLSELDNSDLKLEFEPIDLYTLATTCIDQMQDSGAEERSHIAAGRRAGHDQRQQDAHRGTTLQSVQQCPCAIIRRVAV